MDGTIYVSFMCEIYGKILNIYILPLLKGANVGPDLKEGA